MKKLNILIVFLFATFSLFGQNEHISKFHVDIDVHKDRSLKITEYIQVYAAGSAIKRGITRAFPTSRILGKHGNVNVNYKILSLEKNNEKEPYHSESDNAFKTLYIGSKDVYLKPGFYDYKIEYEVRNQIAFMEDYDEIYWNALGHLNRFSVKEGSVKVHFPEDAKIIQSSAYSGFRGDQNADFSLEKEGNTYYYTMNKVLQPREGFTFGIAVEPGFFEEPGFFHKYGLLLSFLLSVLLLVFYYISTWIKYGIDPKTPPSYPVYDAPDNLSPASAAYISKERNSDATLTSSIIALINAGLIRVEKKGSSGIFGRTNYFISKLGNSHSGLPVEQRILMDLLFTSGKNITIDGDYNPVIQKANSGHQSSLVRQHNDFVKEGNNSIKTLLPFVFLVLSTLGMCFIYFRTSYSEFFHPSMLAIFPIFGLITVLIYSYFIKQPTVEKLDIQSRIQGFKQYISMAESDRMNILNPPEMTVGHFEALLPYAFAFGIEHDWTNVFEKILTESGYNNEHSWMYYDTGFSRSFSRTVSSSSTQPQSSGSGGSSGGGFSGGGGGGGGVGGW